MSIRQNSTPAEKEVWIGLVGVSSGAAINLLEGAKGAWVNVLALAANAEEYRAAVREALDHYGLQLRAMEEVEPLRQRLRRTTVDVALLRLAEEVTNTGFARFGTFHTFVGEDPGFGLRIQ